MVYLTSRNEERGKQAVEALKKEGLDPHYHLLDIDDETSVHTLRDYFVSNYGGLDVLVNNAAILIPYKEGDSIQNFGQQAEITLQTNFFNTYRACMILLPILKPHARVVNLSSMLGHLTQIKGQSEAVVNLRLKLSASDLTYEELKSLMQNFVE